MAVITISKGGKEGAYRGAPGVYVATLVTHSVEGPFDSKQKPGETFMLNEWGFSIDDAPEGAEMVWLTSGMATGPKSKTFAVLTALGGGREPQPGQDVDTDRLMGRQALLDVRENDKGYMDAVGIMPLPAKGRPKPVTPPTAADDDESPF